MFSLQDKFQQLKEKVKADQKEDSLLNSQIKTALKALFCLQQDDTRIICDYHIKNGNLILKAKNKTFANELFLKKSELMDAFEDNKKVRSIIIR
jgi:hypothetical protein